jgi:uridine phosphorylase
VNLAREGWLEAMGMKEDEIPRMIILEGTWWQKQRYPVRLAHLDEVRELEFPDMYWGRIKGRPVMFCCAYGAPRAVEPVHAFGSLGTPCVIQIGSCGALQPGMVTGDIMLPEQAVIGEGASQYYGGSDRSTATPQLVEAAARVFGDNGFNVHRGLHLTTSALFAQNLGLTRNWRDAGYMAVDMETSAVFSAARHFGMRTASLLFVWDELLNDRTWLDPFTPEEQLRQACANEAIFDVALGLLEEVG